MPEDHHDGHGDIGDASANESAPDGLNPYELAPLGRACTRCGRSLDDLPRGAPCPDCPSAPQGPPAADTGLEDYLCASCGYSLSGLNPAGVCPECGLPIRHSLARDLLIGAGPPYVRALHRGALLVLASLIGMALITVGTIVMMFAAGVYGATRGAGAGTGAFSPAGVTLAFSALGFLNSLLGLYGWWLLSSPDPRRLLDQQGGARRVLRAAVVVLAVSALGSTLMQMTSARGAAVPVAMGSAAVILGAVVGLVNFAARITMFVFAMLYLKGLGGRIPDPVVERRAGTYIWLLPLIYVLGFCVLLLGPVVSLVMYAVLINRVRADLVGLMLEQERRPQGTRSD
jgi:hypothetical protein